MGEMVVGMEKGKKTTKIEAAPAPVKSKGACTKHSKAVRDLVREVVGFSPYERRAMEFEDFQGQALPEVPQEAYRFPHPCQEEEGGDGRCPPGNEEEVNPLPICCTQSVESKGKYILKYS